MQRALLYCVIPLRECVESIMHQPGNIALTFQSGLLKMPLASEYPAQLNLIV